MIFKGGVIIGVGEYLYWKAAFIIYFISVLVRAVPSRFIAVLETIQFIVFVINGGNKIITHPFWK